MSTAPLELLSWCPGTNPPDPNDTCFPCKPKPSPPLLPPPASGSWPATAGPVFQIWIYMGQEHYTNSVPDGSGILDGYGSEFVTAAGVGPFGWTWGPSVVSGAGYGAPHFTMYLEFFPFNDASGQFHPSQQIYVGGQGSVPSTDGIARYATMAEPQAIAQQFQSYYYP